MSLKSKLDGKEFVVLAEMEPPKGVEVSQMISNASSIKEHVDAFVIPDLNNAILRMSALGSAVVLQGEELETIMQINCRDRNRLALQADLLSAWACGVTNIMVIEGDDPGLGDHHQTKVVNDIGRIELLDTVRSLKTGHDMAGSELMGSPNFLLGSSIESIGEGEMLEAEVDKIQMEVEKGVSFFMTPPLFDLASAEPILKRTASIPAKIIPTVLLLKSVGMARYIDLHQRNINIPKAVLQRLQDASDTADECVNFAAETASALKREGFDGVHLSTVGWEYKLPDLLDRIEL